MKREIRLLYMVMCEGIANINEFIPTDIYINYINILNKYVIK